MLVSAKPATCHVINQQVFQISLGAMNEDLSQRKMSTKGELKHTFLHVFKIQLI